MTTQPDRHDIGSFNHLIRAIYDLAATQPDSTATYHARIRAEQIVRQLEAQAEASEQLIQDIRRSTPITDGDKALAAAEALRRQAALILNVDSDTVNHDLCIALADAIETISRLFNPRDS